MNKIECMEDYIEGSLFLFFNIFGDGQNLEDFNSNKKNIISSTVSLISTLMLGLKEDIVELQKDMSFESKMFVNSLENAVSFIATKRDDGYYLDNYKFDNSAQLVAILRNKLAHGNFYIDFDNNNIVLIHEDSEINVNIDKLRAFIIMAFNNRIKDIKTKKYKRDFCLYKKMYKNRTKVITTNSELKDIIRNIVYFSFELTTEKEYISQYCISEFINFVNYYNENMETVKETELYKSYKEMQSLFERFDCKLTMSSKKIINEKNEEDLLLYAKSFLVDNPRLEYEGQVKLLVREALKYANLEYRNFESLANNVNLLILLDTMNKVKSTDENIVSNYLIKKDYPNFIINYDTYATMLISILNTLFVYGFDDIYTRPGYNLNRIDEFDFSLLNMSNVKPIICNMDTTELEESECNYNKLDSRVNDLTKKIKKYENQLNLVKKPDAINSINNLLSSMKSDLVKVSALKTSVENYYLSVKEDYDKNQKHFYNKAIINGIRNSIAHGNYEIISGDCMNNNKIIFTDLYNGKETFKLEISFKDLALMISDNIEVISNFLYSSKKIKTR